MPTFLVGMYAPLGMGRAQTCQKTARLRHPRMKGILSSQTRWGPFNVTTQGHRYLLTLREEATMARKVAVQKEPTLAPERALRALTQQLDSLQKLKNRRYDEADSDETEWEHLT